MVIYVTTYDLFKGFEGQMFLAGIVDTSLITCVGANFVMTLPIKWRYQRKIE